MIVVFMLTIGGVVTDPQTKLLNEECSQFKTADTLSNFNSNFNKTFGNIRNQLSGNIHFATALSLDVFGLAQCRNYLSTGDCIACFDAGVNRITRSCPAYDGAHIVLEGCFLRYEAHNFFSEYTEQDNSGVCSTNRSVSQATAFNQVVQGLLPDLVAATPKMNNVYAATTRQVFDGGATATVYAVAQCIETISKSDCQSCLTTAYNNIRDCPPEADGSAINMRCFIRYSNTSFFAENQITNIAQYLKGGGSSMKTAIIGAVVGGLSFLLLILLFFLWNRLRMSKKAGNGNISGINNLQGPLIYSYKDLKAATKNFSLEYKVGEGGFGDVYKGIIKNGDIVAVKKLAITSTRVNTEFESEVRLISNVHHRNIIRLLGCSSKGPEKLLVYEYMENGSLDTFLYGDKRGTLTWKQRVDIITGTARGLTYIHEQFHVCIIHRDIKSSNILLDDDFQPKISDFGLARLLPNDQTHLSTRFAGTLGYTAPEYAIHGHLSEKVDTYAYGIMVLEIISGRRCSDMTNEAGTESLLQYAWKLYENDMHSNLIDQTLDPSEYEVESVKKVIQIALKCTQSPVSIRPTMSEVVVLLVNEGSVDQKPPSKPTVIDGVSTSTTPSISSATFTSMESGGR
ncbi:cysteine-rich receptor-like protein kinase 2 [Heracleum sosnowskyi]|uniref:Cysteine-rich receptor-like protein kinase 2 n=1 Tax=Heracleum sosnowskyi TaxID=360622 RepID=A0AAD8II64_9APIA|nr:cysteine-rich receptor-like protein kinase 2 [Heracleum sosnowskyi]